jgi:hypothetical protein
MFIAGYPWKSEVAEEIFFRKYVLPFTDVQGPGHIWNFDESLPLLTGGTVDMGRQHTRLSTHFNPAGNLKADQVGRHAVALCKNLTLGYKQIDPFDAIRPRRRRARI